jgi:hypothetical protein
MTNPHNGESYVHNHIHRKNQDIHRETRSIGEVTLIIKHEIKTYRTLYEPRKEMRLLFILLMLGACTHSPKQTERKTIPIIDKSGEIHIYRSSNPLELGNDYALYCMEHHHWETISVRYQPAPLAKLRYEEYIVRRHPKSS